jgi:hypothetical protein
MRDLNDVVEQVKGVDEGINNLIVPLLKDTIEDGNRHNKRLFILNVILAIALLVVSIVSQVLVMEQNKKYADFLSQFEFEETVYQETTDNSTINDGIRIMK